MARTIRRKPNLPRVRPEGPVTTKVHTKKSKDRKVKHKKPFDPITAYGDY